MVDTINKLLSSLTVFGQISIILFLLIITSYKVKKISQISLVDSFKRIIIRDAIFLSFIVALTAMLGSLFFSDVAGFEPCVLCWYQRILMYPNVVLLAIAIKKKSDEIIDYILWLTGPGAILAFYHYSQQMSANPLLPCKIVGYSSSCSEKFFTHFGYITIPLMSATAFTMIFLLLLIRKFDLNKNRKK